LGAIENAQRGANMPYNIYDRGGKKIGSITTPSEQAAGAALFLYLLPYLLGLVLLGIIIYGGVLGFYGYWWWARSALPLTNDADINGIIITLIVFIISFLVALPWENVFRRREVQIMSVMWRSGLSMLVVDAVLGLLNTLTIPATQYSSFVRERQYSGSESIFFIAVPITFSFLVSLLRFYVVREIYKVLLGIPFYTFVLTIGMLWIFQLVFALLGVKVNPENIIGIIVVVAFVLSIIWGISHLVKTFKRNL
jgi:hypothetical protein